MDGSLPGPFVHGDSPGKNTGVGCQALFQGNLPNPGIKPRSPALQVDSLPAEPLGEPKHTGVGSLSLLQVIFPTQESNWDHPHCPQVFYQLSTREAPIGERKALNQRSPSNQAVLRGYEGQAEHATRGPCWRQGVDDPRV